jgi:hypothetical protein
VIAFVFDLNMDDAGTMWKVRVFLKNAKQQLQAKLQKLKVNVSKNRLKIGKVEADMTDSKFQGFYPVEKEFGAVVILKEQEPGWEYIETEKPKIENRSVKRPSVNPPGNTAPSTWVEARGGLPKEFTRVQTSRVTDHFRTEQETLGFISAAQGSGRTEVTQVISPTKVGEAHKTGSQVIKLEKEVIVRLREIEHVKRENFYEEVARAEKLAEYVRFYQTLPFAVEYEIAESINKLSEQMANTSKRTEQLVEGILKLMTLLPMPQTAALSERKTGKKNNPNRSSIICYFCRKEGHILRKCIAFQKARKNATGDCSVEGRAGHSAAGFRGALGQRMDNGSVMGAPHTNPLNSEN